MTETEMSKELDGKLRQYKRLILSYADFKHAHMVSGYILSSRLHETTKGESKVIHEALNCSMIIAYCRPFSGNDSRSLEKIPDLPKSILDVLDSNEREIHKVVMQDRNTLLGHSDSEALNLDAVVWQVNKDIETIVPLKNWGLAPLTEKATEVFYSTARKLFEAALMRRLALEPEVRQYLPKVDTETLAKMSAGEKSGG